MIIDINLQPEYFMHRTEFVMTKHFMRPKINDSKLSFDVLNYVDLL